MSLASLAQLGGLLLLLIGAGLLFRPRTAAAVLRAFPRHVWAGRLLAALDILWAAWLLRAAGFAWITQRPALIPLAIPVAYALVIIFVDELLAARALGGLLLLLPLPVLDAAFVHPTNARLVMTVLAYLCAITGMIWVWSPYKLRQWTEGWMARATLARAAGVAFAGLGLLLCLLGFFVY